MTAVGDNRANQGPAAPWAEHRPLTVARGIESLLTPDVGRTVVLNPKKDN